MSGRRDIVHPTSLADLKRGTADLTVAYGSQSAAEALTGIRQQKLSDLGNPNTPDFIAVDTVYELESRTVGKPGWPHVTRTLCRLNGGVFVRLPDARDAQGDWLGLLGGLSAETGDIINGIATALADDRRIDVKEARKLRLEVADGQQKLAEIDAALAAIVGDT